MAYKIQWTCCNSGRRGEGRDHYDNKTQAQDIADDLNEQFPEVAHYVVETTDED